MKTITINVEVPDDCTAKYDAATHTVKFIPNVYKNIKDFTTACEVLGISSVIPNEIRSNKHLCAMYKMQIVLKAVNQDHTFDLIDGNIWYPIVRFIDKRKVKKEILYGESEVLDFNYKNRTFTLIGGSSYAGTSYGIGSFSSYDSAGRTFAQTSLFACYNEQIAKHVSKYFAPLIFDCCFANDLGFSLSNGEMVTTDEYFIGD